MIQKRQAKENFKESLINKTANYCKFKGNENRKTHRFAISILKEHFQSIGVNKSLAVGNESLNGEYSASRSKIHFREL